MTRAGCPDDATIARFGDGLLTQLEQAEIERHAAECPTCSKLIALLAQDSVPYTGEPPLFAGRYRILDVAGAGGMGIVSVALDVTLGRKVAIKRMRRAFGTAVDPEQSRARFMREARLLASLSHQNVLAVFDVGCVDDTPYVVMEFVDGWSASEWQRETNPGWRSVAEVYLKVAHGLAAAHDAGIVHRDVKPGNILVDRAGRVLLIDFGLAGVSASDPNAGETLTASGVQMGTPAFMAPELLQGGAAGPRSDQYSFCVALYQALHGHLPLVRPPSAASPSGLGGAPRSQSSQVSGRLDRVLRRGFAADPEQRYPSMQALLVALEIAMRPTRWWRASRLVPVLLVAGTALAGGVLWVRSTSERQAPAPLHEAKTPAEDAAATRAARASQSDPRGEGIARAQPPRDIASEARPPDPVRRPSSRASARNETAATTPAQRARAQGSAARVDQDDASSSWRKSEYLASIGDGRGCLSALKKTDLPDSAIEIPRAHCEMALGNCENGRSILRDALANQGLRGLNLDTLVARDARLYCPLTAFDGAGDLLKALHEKVMTFKWNSDLTQCQRLRRDAKGLIAQFGLGGPCRDDSCAHGRALAGILDDLSTCYLGAGRYDDWVALDIEAAYSSSRELLAIDVLHRAQWRLAEVKSLPDHGFAGRAEADLMHWQDLVALESKVAARPNASAGAEADVGVEALQSAARRLGVRCDWNAQRRACVFSPERLLRF